MNSTKNTSLRIQLQQAIYLVINPFVRLLIKMGLTPNAVTTIGLVLNVGVAAIFVFGAEEGNRGDLSFVGWAGALVLFAGLFDMLDGQVARLGNMGSTFGALYDSVLDRYSELILFLGICYYLVAHHYFLSSLFAFIALIGSIMVSYTRARAEGLGIECKEGLMQRPERVITIGVTAIACGITASIIGGNHKWYWPGTQFQVLETISIFTLPLAFMAILTNITAVNRLTSAKKALEKKERGNLKALLILLISTLTLCTAQAQHSTVTKKVVEEQDTLPVPPSSSKLLFYLQRSPNSNTILCELNLLANGQLNEEEPVHVSWIRYTEGGVRKELNYIQRVFAYGIKSTPLGNGSYKLQFVSYKKQEFLLMKSPKDGKYHVYATINQKQSIVQRFFIKVEGGSFWKPNVVYLEKKGIDPSTGKEVMERFKP